MTSATAILSEAYGIQARPGRKVECPFCHKKTFSIKKDDSLGKCFHPACGRFIAASSSKAGYGHDLHRILDTVWQDMHTSLLALNCAPHPNAYDYCIKERNIHPRVVADSMLGVIPSGYSVADRFAPVIRETETAISNEKEKRKGKRKTSKKQLENVARERLEFLVQARDQLEDCIRHKNGWLAFFYSDFRHNIIAVRFREPYSKRIVYYKPTPIGGVFNHGLFAPLDNPSLKHLNDLLIVVEGEFNQLQLQSLCARYAEKKGQVLESGYVFSCAVGGVHNADAETIRRLGKSPIVCYDNDASGAGFALVDAVLKKVSASAFTTPEKDSDLDDFIRGFGSDVEKAHEAVKALVKGRQPFQRPFNVVRGEIDGIRRRESIKSGLKTFEVHRYVSEAVLTDLSERGRFYHDGRLSYYYLASDKKLLLIGKDNQDLELLLMRYGIAPSDRLFGALIDALRLEAHVNGTKTEIYSFSHFDVKTCTLYLFDLGQTVYRIKAEEVEAVDNGTDEVLFLHNPSWQTYEVGEDDHDRSYFDDVILGPIQFQEGELSRDDMRLVFFVWFYALFFPELFPTKPILAIIGEPGSGKTFILRKVGQLLFGSSFNVMQLSNDQKDFDAAVTNEAFVAVDNSDSKVRWLDDKLAVIATGSTLKRRELYTTNRLIDFPVRAFVGITSRTPHFRREDVSDRLLLMRVERFEQFVAESRLLSNLHEKRNFIMTEVIGHLLKIVRALKNQRAQSYATSFRMADFADFALKIAHGQGWGARMEGILNRLVGEQTAFTIDGDTLFDLLDLWLAKDGGKNHGREVITAKLCKELEAVADAHGIDFFYQGNTKSLAQRLRNIMSTLKTFYDITDRTRGGRKRYLSFRPKNKKGGG